jgi:hypothetical protein
VDTQAIDDALDARQVSDPVLDIFPLGVCIDGAFEDSDAVVDPDLYPIAFCIGELG